MSILKRYLRAILICPLIFTACTQPKTGPEYHIEEYAQEDSLGFLDRMIRTNPNEPKHYFDKAQYVLRSGDIPTVIELMRAAISLDSNNVEYHFFLSSVFGRTAEFDKSLAIMRRCVSIAPENARAQIKLGEVWAMKGNSDSAFHYINQGLRRDITDPYAYYLKGLIYKRLGNYERSTSSFQTAVEQDPNYYDAYFELGLNYLTRDTALAIQYLENAINVGATPIEALSTRAKLYSAIDSLELAIDDYKEVLRIDSLNAGNHAALGSVYLQMDKPEDARQSFQISIALDPDSHTSLTGYAYSMEVLGDLTEARNAYERALEIMPGYSLAVEGLNRTRN